jgi:ankyrin repeat protein
VQPGYPRNSSPFNIALHTYEHRNIFWDLIDFGANPLVPDEDGKTIFHYAAGDISSLDFIKQILSKGLNLTDHQGRTPLFEALLIDNCEERLEAIRKLMPSTVFQSIILFSNFMVTTYT